MQKILSLFCILLTMFYAGAAEPSVRMRNAITANDISAVIAEASTSSDNEEVALVALSTRINPQHYTFEQLTDWYTASRSPKIKALLERARQKEEAAIIKQLADLSAEELKEYSSHFPQRKRIVDDYLKNVVLNNTDALSFRELVYLADNDCETDSLTLQSAMVQRIPEKKQMLGEDAKQLLDNELLLADRLKYTIDKYLWTYFVTAHGQLNESYSKVGLVPDYASAAASQYQKMVAAYFSSETIRKSLQKEVDKFCAEINKVRKDHFLACGKKDYPKLSYKVPTFKLSTNVSTAPLNGIAESRQQYVESREAVSQGSGIIGWIFGPLGGLIAKGIGDWVAIQDLVDAENRAREEYVKSVHDALYSNIDKYSTQVISGLHKSIVNSQSIYIAKLTE